MALARTNAANLFAYHPDSIAVDPEFNPRDMAAPDTLAWVAEIAASIKERGFDPDRPLLGRVVGDSFIVTDGHCRLAAIRQLLAAGEPIIGVPCRSEPQGMSREERQLLSLRAPGKALTALEASVAIKRLMSWGWSQASIAAKLGKSSTWVSGCLDLAGAPQPLREAVRNGEIASSEATRMARTEADPVATFKRAKEHAVSDGRKQVRPRDVEAVRDKPRQVAVSLCSVAVAAIIAWESGDSVELDSALDNLARHIGPATLDAARGRKAA